MITLAGAAEALRSGASPSDKVFDGVYPKALQAISTVHFSPVAVAVRAAQLFEEASVQKVLDVGSGVGKFCVIGSLCTKATHFTGVEQRPALVEVARNSATRMGANRTEFVEGNAMDVQLGDFDGIYMFNPFFEQISRSRIQVDATMPRSRFLFRSYSFNVFRKLSQARTGLKIVTYHGCGFRLPEAFRLVTREAAGNDYLSFFNKES